MESAKTQPTAKFWKKRSLPNACKLETKKLELEHINVPEETRAGGRR
jgi:hypothetical protein